MAQDQALIRSIKTSMKCTDIRTIRTAHPGTEPGAITPQVPTINPRIIRSADRGKTVTVGHEARQGQTVKIMDEERPYAEMNAEPHQDGFPEPPAPARASAPCVFPQGEYREYAERRPEGQLKARSQHRFRLLDQNPAGRQKNRIISGDVATQRRRHQSDHRGHRGPHDGRIPSHCRRIKNHRQKTDPERMPSGD